MSLIISLLLGAIGGNIAGALIKKINLGLPGNSVTGIIGGGMGNQILQSALIGSINSSVNNSMISSVVGGAAGGILVMVLIGIIKRSWTQAKT